MTTMRAIQVHTYGDATQLHLEEIPQPVPGEGEVLVRVHASSGTTGRPIVVGYTKGDIDTWSDVMARSIRAAGGRTGMIMHNAYGYGLFTGGLGAHYGAERLGCTVVPVSGGRA